MQTDREVFENVARGFMLMETMSPEWLENYFLKYGGDIAFDIDTDSKKLYDVIIETGNIRKFLVDLVDDSTIISALIPSKYEHVGMIDKWRNDFEVYAEAWARIIKTYIIQGLNVLHRLQDSHDINSALDIDSFDLENNTYFHDGDNIINMEKIANRLGVEGMVALHALFHSMSPDDFHRFLTDFPGITMPVTAMGEVITVARLVSQYVRPKNLAKFLPPGPNKNYGSSISNKIDNKALVDLDLKNLNLN